MSKYFTIKGDPKLLCSHCLQHGVEDSFLDRLDQLREAVGFPLIVTSGYRCPEYNQKVSTTGPDGPHTTGRAVDLQVAYYHAFRVVEEAMKLGFTGIGVKQRGASRFIHLDDLEATPTRPRPRIWSYP